MKRIQRLHYLATVFIIGTTFLVGIPGKETAQAATDQIPENAEAVLAQLNDELPGFSRLGKPCVINAWPRTRRNSAISPPTDFPGSMSGRRKSMMIWRAVPLVSGAACSQPGQPRPQPPLPPAVRRWIHAAVSPAAA